VHLAAPADERDEPGHVPGLDVAGHDVAHAGEPPARESCAAHVLILL
jgi:hypothetical protein